VDEVLISFQRPASMSRSEMRAWVSERARNGQPAVTLSAADEAELLRVEVRDDSIEAATEQLADLMLDMRLLGLCPTVVPPHG
jgi:hypothetical protein